MKGFFRVFWAFAIAYLLVTSFFFLVNASSRPIAILFLYPDRTTIDRIEVAQNQHVTQFSKHFAKVFYNKPLGYLQTYLDNVYRSIDLPFLFTLTTGSSMYDDQGPMQMLYPVELPLFLFALILLIRSKENKKYIWLVWLISLATFLPAFFLPALSQIKLFPFIIAVRLLIIFGLYEGVKIWQKK